MRQIYQWYFWQSQEQANGPWDNGILTVDANVLLDLYRYHEGTREELLTCLESFHGRIWISRQAADEFIRNRAKVIVSASTEYGSAQKELERLSTELSRTLEGLRAYRTIDSLIYDTLDEHAGKAIDEARSKIAENESKHPPFLDSDPVLTRLFSLFDDRVGETFADDYLAKVIKEGEERIRNQVPPGYLDKEKNGTRPLGDFFLWRQVLDNAKKEGKSMILVTSERKEDWWEKQSGKTIGPRQELQREAYEYSGQKVLIYQTTRFVEIASQRMGRAVNDAAVNEIRAVDEARRPDASPIVRIISQEIHRCGAAASDGTLTVEILRPAFKFTATGHFEPILTSSPALSIRLIESPDPMPGYRMSAGTGTRHDFNVHLKSDEYGVFLPPGVYKFSYTARAVAASVDEVEPAEEQEI